MICTVNQASNYLYLYNQIFGPMKFLTRLLCLNIVLFALALFTNLSLVAQTDGNVVFSVLTVSNGATYSPKHVFSIWVKDNQGNFVISRKVMANNQKRHLVKWVANSAQNTVNALTGATLPNHIAHTVSWDCRDVNGNLVPDGIYEIWVEYTSRNSANGGDPGPSTKAAFLKGTSPVTVAPVDEAYFKNMNLEYTPHGVDAFNELPDMLNFKVFPMPFTDQINMEFTLPKASFINISAYNLVGQRVKEIVNTIIPQGNNILFWNGKNSTGITIPKGIYVLRITYLGKVYSCKIIRTRG